MKTKFPIPDTVLRDAYLTVAREVEMYRENFISETENIKAVRRLLKGVPADVSDDDMRRRIIHCAKNPERHGGGWNATPDGHGAEKGHSPKISKELREHYQSQQYAEVKDIVMNANGRQCIVCSAPCEEGHHCRYDRIGTTEEINDVVPVCKKCHPTLDRLRKKNTPKR